MTHFLYNLLFPFVLLLMLPGYLLRMIRRGNYRHKFGQRFGIYSEETQARFATGNWTWMHAVSVGEINIALKLAAALKKQEPDLHLALSTTTTTGFQLASARAPEWVEVLYNPVDFLPFVRRALRLVRPRRLILIEAEVWPNFTWSAKKHGIPIALVNARLSPRSARRFAKFKVFTAPVFQRLDLICAQEPADVETWKTLGAREGALRCVGSIKFDYEDQPPPDASAFRVLLADIGVTETTRILLAGSTHAGEEILLARLHRELKITDSLLIIAPRHVERCKTLQAELEQEGFTVTRRSRISPATSLPDILLLDTTGELARWYPLGTVIFIGKSLLAIGGQNPVEAVIAGRPVLFGPHMENFPVITQNLLRHKAAIQINNANELREEVRRLFADAEQRARMQQGAQAALSAHQGATKRTVKLLGNINLLEL